jgi:5-methylcytosine-specific restriction endonuclease McrA
MSTTAHHDTDPAGSARFGSGQEVLDAVVEAAAEERRGAARKLAAALVWAHAHPGSEGDCASWEPQRRFGLARERGQDCLDYLGGQGTPPVAEFAVEQLATRLGVSTGSAMSLVADALNLFHRHPRLWRRVQELSCPAWLARKVATACATLPLEGARWVDETTARLTGRAAFGTILRQIAYATAKWCPAQTKDAEDAAKDSRKLDLRLPSDTEAGTSAAVAEVYGRLSTTDAVKFDALVAAKAADLAQAGDTSSLDVRRSKALGLIADQLLSGELDLDSCDAEAGTGLGGLPDLSATKADTDSANQAGQQPVSRSVMPVRKAASTTLFVHVSLADLATAAFASRPGLGPVDLDGLPIDLRDPAVGWVEKHGPVVLETIREWLAETNATIRPVLDLGRVDAVNRDDPPGWMRELVIQRDGLCIHPYCGTPARACDLDHITEYVPLAEGWPPGQTSPENLAALCRRHHRCKTFTRWRYRRRRDGTYQWTDPEGKRFRVVPRGGGTYPITDANHTDADDDRDTGPPGTTAA